MYSKLASSSSIFANTDYNWGKTIGILTRNGWVAKARESLPKFGESFARRARNPNPRETRRCYGALAFGS